jgi:cytochrome P450
VTRRFNPFDPDQAHDSWCLLAELRKERAVVDIGDEMAYVTRHAECRHILRDTDDFSSARGFKAPGVIVPVEDRTLGELDPPNHTLPRDDVTTRLLELEIEGERLTPRQLRAMVRNLITGGLTTTSQLLGNLLYQLLFVPGLEDRLRSQPESRPRAIEESLRLAPPVMFIPRSCVRDAEVDGTVLHADQRLIVGTGCANRDEAAFENGDDFDVDRTNLADHLTFGYGPHFCPGAPLARAVARIGLTTFLGHFPPGTIRLTDGFVYENVPAFFETGPKHLTVRTTRRP